jgi:hypothetical protein
VRWLVEERGGRLKFGVEILPGTPEPVVVRGSGRGAADGPQQALLLPAAPGLKMPATLIIPSALLEKPEVEVRLRDNQLFRCQLTRSRDQGCDFARVEFVRLPA